ncbi:MAG TPA: hypothetical protein VFK40_05350 [Nitrososphaeraceae archaeon]|nr:hypothetical protein [Nitrososphaeraceae archaeon]
MSRITMMLTEPLKPAFALQEWLIYHMGLPLRSNVFVHSNLEVSLSYVPRKVPDFPSSSM